jgi:hypothetical protein
MKSLHSFPVTLSVIHVSIIQRVVDMDAEGLETLKDTGIGSVIEVRLLTSSICMHS